MLCKHASRKGSFYSDHCTIAYGLKYLLDRVFTMHRDQMIWLGGHIISCPFLTSLYLILHVTMDSGSLLHDKHETPTRYGDTLPSWKKVLMLQSTMQG